MRRPAQDLTGQRFGRITVIAFNHKDDRGETYWLCKCDCGKETVVKRYSLISGHTKSCGCYGLETVKYHMYKHGGYKTKLYAVWNRMKDRCSKSSGSDYLYYRSKGIAVCDEWKSDFLKFKEWALNNGYKEGLSIDRIDGDKGYSPNNCRWATCITQNNNQHGNAIIEIDSVKNTIANWCREFGLRYGLVMRRRRCGWDERDLFCLPMRNGNIL
jgi:hypothetical protein